MTTDATRASLSNGQDWGAFGVKVAFGTTTALDHVSLATVPWQAAAVGGDGAGKTTLLRTLVGRVRPAAGHVQAPGTRHSRVRVHAHGASRVWQDLTVQASSRASTAGSEIRRPPRPQVHLRTGGRVPAAAWTLWARPNRRVHPHAQHPAGSHRSEPVQRRRAAWSPLRGDSQMSLNLVPGCPQLGFVASQHGWIRSPSPPASPSPRRPDGLCRSARLLCGRCGEPASSACAYGCRDVGDLTRDRPRRRNGAGHGTRTRSRRPACG
ncbi:ATP-binding cassette domain-containing protein [Streptomyces sp. NPDC055749]